MYFFHTIISLYCFFLISSRPICFCLFYSIYQEQFRNFFQMLSNQNSYLSTGLLPMPVTALSHMFLPSLQTPILILILSGSSWNGMLNYIHTISFIYLFVTMLLKWTYCCQCYCYIRNTNFGSTKMHIFTYDWVIWSVYVSCFTKTVEGWRDVLAVSSVHRLLIRKVSCESDFPLYLKFLPPQNAFSTGMWQMKE